MRKKKEQRERIHYLEEDISHGYDIATTHLFDFMRMYFANRERQGLPINALQIVENILEANPGLVNDKIDGHCILAVPSVIKEIDGPIVDMFYRYGFNHTKEFFDEWVQTVGKEPKSMLDPICRDYYGVINKLCQYDKDALSFQDLWLDKTWMTDCFSEAAVRFYGSQVDLNEKFTEYIKTHEFISKNTLLAFKKNHVNINFIENTPVAIYYLNNGVFNATSIEEMAKAGVSLESTDQDGKSIVKHLKEKLIDINTQDYKEQTYYIALQILKEYNFT